MTPIGRRWRGTSALLALAIYMSFTAAAHHHHDLDRSALAPSLGAEAGAPGSGLLCHACILGGTPVELTTDVVATRPPSTDPIDAPLPDAPPLRWTDRDGIESRGPPASV